MLGEVHGRGIATAVVLATGTVASTRREWICAGPWAIPADFRHARDSALRWPIIRNFVAKRAHEDVQKCGGCHMSAEDAESTPLLKGDWVSLKHGFWFRRTPKCAQTSVSHFFQQCAHLLDLHPNEALFAAVGDGQALDSFLEQAVAQQFTYVALVRDPVDRFISGYNELWARLALFNMSRATLRYCLGLDNQNMNIALHSEPKRVCDNIDREDQTLYALANSKFYDWPTDIYADRTILAVLHEINRASWPGGCTSEVKSHARSLNHLFPQAWLIGRAAARAMVSREVYIGSRLGAWPDVLLRTENLEHDLAHFLASIQINTTDCPLHHTLHLNRMASDANNSTKDAFTLDRGRLRRALLQGNPRKRFCRTFAIDFLYLGYEISWRKYCSHAVDNSFNLQVKGRLVFAVEAVKSRSRQRKMG